MKDLFGISFGLAFTIAFGFVIWKFYDILERHFTYEQIWKGLKWTVFVLFVASVVTAIVTWHLM